jgi:hypothetical protein
MGRRRWTYRSALLVGIGGFAVTVVITWSLLNRTNPSDGAAIANVLALPVGIVGTIAALLGLRSRPMATDSASLEEQAQVLTEAIATAEARALVQLLGDAGEARPADVGFAHTDASLVTWRSDGGDRTGSLSTISQYYDGLQLGRLVVLGEAGSGKTVLALRLLLDLAAARRSGPDGSNIRIPVRLSLPGFVPASDSPSELRDELDRWIARHLAVSYNVHPTVADALVTRGWLLPILDGLDELDPIGAAPETARKVLAALNLPVGPKPAPVVLTCRMTTYLKICTGGTAGHALEDATAVTLQPLQSTQAVAWLEHRLPNPEARRRWEPVITELHSRPRGPLARCLSSPLRLYLALTVYAQPQVDPSNLCDLQAPELDNHLYAQLVPALTDQYPRPNGSRYAATDVERWLGTLASSLVRLGGNRGPATDLSLSYIWRTVGDPPGRLAQRQALAVLAAILLGPSIVAWMALTGPGFWSIDTAVTAVWFAFVVRILYGAIAPGTPRLLRVDLRRAGSRRTRRGVVRSIWSGLKLGPQWGLIAAYTYAVFRAYVPTDAQDLLQLLLKTTAVGVAGGLLLGLLVGLFTGLLSGITVIRESASTPSEPHRQAVTAAFSTIAAITILVGVIQTGPILAVIGGMLVGLPLGIAASGAESWYIQYKLHVLTQARSGTLPRKLPEFLDWGYRAGVLRLSGASTQFRHREVQEYFESRAQATRPAA